MTLTLVFFDALRVASARPVCVTLRIALSILAIYELVLSKGYQLLPFIMDCLSQSQEHVDSRWTGQAPDTHHS